MENIISIMIVMLILLILYLDRFGTKPMFCPCNSNRIIFYERRSIPYIDNLKKLGEDFELLTFELDDIVINYPYHLVERVAISEEVSRYANKLIDQNRGLSYIDDPYIKIAELSMQWNIEIEILCYKNDPFTQVIIGYLNNEKISNLAKGDPCCIFEHLKFPLAKYD